jgi:hypothetical protein
MITNRYCHGVIESGESKSKGREHSILDQRKSYEQSWFCVVLCGVELIKKKLKLRITCLVILCNNIKQEEQR